jgi:hypothetical protein
MDFKLRSVNTKFWDDPYISDLDPIEKLLFLYLITNPMTNLAGVYEIPLRRIAFDTGIDRDMVLKIFERFSKDKKVYYINDYVVLVNFYKNQHYNKSMLVNAKNTIKSLPQSIVEFIETLCDHPVYTLYTSCGQVEDEEEGKEEVEGKEESEEEKGGVSTPPVYQEVFDKWNNFASKYDLSKIKTLTQKRKIGVRKRLGEKYFDFDAILNAIAESDFLLGKADSGWRVDFDFIFCQQDKWIKILEGKYGGKAGISKTRNSAAEFIKDMEDAKF